RTVRIMRGLVLVSLLGGALALVPDALGAAPQPQWTSKAFWVGDPAAPMYVERLTPAAGARQPYPLILVHGAGQTGASSWLATPDGREGWAPYFVQRGFTTYVVDLPGHGRSGQPPTFPRWSAPRYVEALEALLDWTGPALVLTHSMGGRIGWKLAERAPTQIVGLFAVTPAPPPNIVPRSANPLPEDAPFYQPPEFARAALADTPTFPLEAWDTFLATLVPESPHAVNEGRNAAGPELYVGPELLRAIPPLPLPRHLDLPHPP